MLSKVDLERKPEIMTEQVEFKLAILIAVIHAIKKFLDTTVFITSAIMAHDYLETIVHLKKLSYI